VSLKPVLPAGSSSPGEANCQIGWLQEVVTPIIVL